MSDLIKRSDAIEVAYQLRRKPNDEEWDWWIRSFNAIPSADRPQGWIPCSERLPELIMHVSDPELGEWDNSEPVLVLHKDKKFECKWMVAQFTDGFADVYGHVEYGWVEANGFEEVENVIAWMPIPDSLEQE